ncbi:hypothetical protein L1987_50657 [Smallanthus sonchifolius]|uniref:Uncharacterized protein n=1 Tax=Smallanthus sonchifolius TaxID=185202 RepID=A0ACB9EMY5_9ASTR|nr:hypothetical protein L1987_50657 [Smallanthus sonchifolius]
MSTLYPDRTPYSAINAHNINKSYVSFSFPSINLIVLNLMADGEENELMLELSIGGIFGNPKKPEENRIEDLNVKPKGEIEHLRRRKREEKVKKPVDFGSCGSVSGPFVENKEWLDTQIVRNDEPARKKEKIGNLREMVVAPVDGDMNCGFRSTACRSFRPYKGNLNLKPDEHEIDGGGRCCCKINLNGGATSAYFDGQCSSHQGGVTDDSRSNSSNSQLDQQPASTSTASVEPLVLSDQPSGSSKQTTSTSKLTDSNPHESGVVNPHSKPETNSRHQQASLLARMPCVSTTGNGPNGKTVSGFLYRYTKNEVSIVCVCHGRSFSPAGFVEHAGGVDITHPLKHITIFPAAFAS